MATFNLPMDQIGQFVFVIVRIGAILFSTPFFSSRNVPMLVKSSLTLGMAIVVVPQLKVPAPSLMGDPFLLVTGLLGEVAMGLIIGLIFQLLISGIQLAGELTGFQMGIALANVMDPTSSVQIPILSQFMNLFALLTFFVLNMHHYFIKVLARSFEIIPPFSTQINNNLMALVMNNAANLFLVAIQFGAPVMVGLLLSSVALALTARTVPQVQIFVVAMPLKVLLGLIFTAISLPFCSAYLFKSYNHLAQTIISILTLFK